MNELGVLLRNERQKKNMSINALVRKSGVSKGYISQIENGQFKPSHDVLKKLSQGLGVSYLDLLTKAGYIDSSTKEAVSIVEPFFIIDALSHSLDKDLTSLLVEENIPYEYNQSLSPEENEERQKELTKFFNRNIKDIYELLNNNSDLYFKERLLSKEEKEKILSIIETLLN